MEEKYYLFKDNTIIKKSNNIQELKEIIVNMNLHIDTAPYYCKIDSLNILEEFADSHEGVYFPVCDFLDINKNFVDVFIVEEFYAYQDKEWQKEIERFNKENKG